MCLLIFMKESACRTVSLRVTHTAVRDWACCYVGTLLSLFQMLSCRFMAAVKELETLNKTLESIYSTNVNKQTELQTALTKVEQELEEVLNMKKALEEQK